MKFQIKEAEFFFSADSNQNIKVSDLPEVAVVGRSNVGKSTFINRLTYRNKLARASDTPGRTQAIVGFKTRVSVSKTKDKNLMLVDLPGFGFAKLSKPERERLHILLNEYIRFREELKVVLLLNDCRRMPEDEELIVRDLAAQAGKHLLVVVNKVDKLKRNELVANTTAIAEAYGLLKGDVLTSGEGISPDDIWGRILGVLD